ncbi:MAG TPA: FAD binding domain-containing protein [Phototrophicaceae bacterium]|nr:FAD binding domain-containing protein [Phototrophicaceae bacterium]
MWEHYFSVISVDETVQLLAEYGERARIIAGGTDILLEMERQQRPGVDVLIDVSRIAGLDTIEQTGDQIHLGALVTHNQVVASTLLRQLALPLVQASWEVGAPQIRNRATVAGNLITASPANDTICPLIALDANITLRSVTGERVVPLREFYAGLRRTVMRPDEMLTTINIPAMKSNQRGVFLKLALRRAQAISVVNVTAILQLDEQTHTVRQAAVAMGSVAPTIIRLPEVERSLTGKTLNPATIIEAAKLAGQIPTPIDDIRSTAVYRTEMIKVLMNRALTALTTTTYDQLPDKPAMLWGTGRAQLDQSIKHEPDQQPIATTVNGQSRIIHTGQEKTLLNFLRDDVGLPGTKEGCAEGECGACTIFLDGAAVMSCMIAAPRAHGAEIVTVEGLQTENQLHPIQEAFIEQAAVQCGYCTPGFLMSGASLLEEHPEPTLEQIQQSISGNLCRCTGYYKIVDAFIEASKKAKARETMP